MMSAIFLKRMAMILSDCVALAMNVCIRMLQCEENHQAWTVLHIGKETVLTARWIGMLRGHPISRLTIRLV